MRTTSKSFVLLIILIIFTSGLILSFDKLAFAQSTKPSPPEFTAQAPNESTIELVIKNQAFTSSESVNSIIYYYQVKDHNSEYPWIRSGNYQLQSDSETTIITIKTPYPSDYPFVSPMQRFVNGSLIDFQVQAVTGYYRVVPISGGATIYFNASETSDWSNTQTVNLTQPLSPHPTATLQPTAKPTASPTPTSSPTATPSSFQFNVSVGDKTYPVIANSNSTVTDLTFNPAIKELNFKADGQTGTTGYCTITIPTTLVSGELSVYKDEILLVKNVDYTISNDGTNNILQINYSHSTHNFKIAGTLAIPEFSWLAILPLFFSMLSFAVILRHQKTISQNKPNVLRKKHKLNLQ
jgi:hypothetical protein